MKQPANLCRVYNSITENVGRKVQVKSNKGRNKFDITEGIITETYPCVFLIEVDSDTAYAGKTVTYSYTDVLTKEVEVVFAN